MVELGELQKRHQDFDNQGVEIVAISNDDLETAAGTKKLFPALTIVSDADQNMAKAFEVIHPGAGRFGEDTNAPTIFLVDGRGQVRDLVRPERFVTRLAPDELLAEIERSFR